MTPNWKLIVLLVNVIGTISATLLTKEMLHSLSELITAHHAMFCQVYPELHLKYKLHRMVHYPSVLLKNGPLLLM
jgi:hypothetical protein